MTGLTAHSEKLCKIFKLLLSASSPGEVVAARNAMLAVVGGEDMDLHDLAQVLADGLRPRQTVVYKPPSIEQPACDVAAWCQFQFDKGHAVPRDPREYKFIVSMTK
jgi:hypothetical protein